MQYKDVLNEKGFLLLSPKGNSMKPFIHPDQDLVKLVEVRSKLKKYDVVLYQKDDQTYILHRIIKVMNDRLLMRGDNEFIKSVIDQHMVVAVMEGSYRGERFMSERRLTRRLRVILWHHLSIPRRVIRKSYRTLFKGKKT